MRTILELYRKIPALPALAFAALGAAISALAVTVAGVFAISKTLDWSGQSTDLGAGILVITAIPNIIVPGFIVAFTLLVHVHSRASWKTPTFAFIVGAVATWIWIGPFNLVFAPFVLGTGALTCLISCLILRQKENPPAQHALQTQI